MTDARAVASTPLGRLSIQQFLTDGKFMRLCAAVTDLVGVRCLLHDAQGNLVELAEDAASWRTVPAPPYGPEQVRFPLLAGGGEIGALVLPDGATDDLRARLDPVLQLFAAIAGELCDDVIDTRNLLRETEALFHLASLLSSAQGVEAVLQACLDTALDALDLKGGSLVLLPEGSEGRIGEVDREDDVVLKAAKGLSEDWLSDPRPLSRGREFDRLAFRGEVVAVPNLQADPRVLHPERAEGQGARSFLSAGLLYRGKPIGVIRLYGAAPRRFTRQEQRLILSIAQHGAVAVHQARVAELEREEARVRRQLEVGRDVQARMMPASLPRVAGWGFAARCLSSFELSGDFFDVFERISEGTIGFLLGDVVGKGVAAALMMASVRSAVRAWEAEGYPVEEVLVRVNGAMTRDTLQSEFVTMVFCDLDPATGRLEYANAGHEPPLIARVERGAGGSADGVVNAGAGGGVGVEAGSVSLRSLPRGGLVAGVVHPQAYQRHSVDLEPGEVLVLYTDGVTDAQAFDGRKFGAGRLRATIEQVLTEQPDATAEQLMDAIIWAIRRFVGVARQADDETILVVRRDPA